MERYRQATKKSESSQQETDAPSKASIKWRSKPLDLQTAGLFSDDHPAIKLLKAELDLAKAASDESVLLSKRIRAVQNLIAMHERDLKGANERVQEAEHSIVASQKSLEQHRAKVEDIEQALKERRNHMEHLHRQAAAEASHGADATQLEFMFPDAITKHLPQEAKETSKRKAQAAAKEAAARPPKEATELDEFGGLDDQDDPTAEVRIQVSIDDLLQAQTRGDPERLAVLLAQMARVSAYWCRKRNRSRCSSGRNRAAEISIVTINGNFWTAHAEWMAQVGPQRLVLGQEHRLEAGRCEEEAGKLERQGWRCGFSPAKRNALKTKTDSSLALSAGTFVAAPKHWGLEWVWPARSWQSKELQAHQGRLTMAWVPIMEGDSQFSVSTSIIRRTGQSATNGCRRRRALKLPGAVDRGG